MTCGFQRALLARRLCLAFAALFALRTTNTRGEEPEDPEEARDRAGAGHVERLWYLPSPDAALWAYEVAKSSVENRKTLWIGSNGDPFGSNLVFVVEFP